MVIQLDAVGKKYNQHWIFRNCTLEFIPNNPVAIIGANGSGKTTFLQVIAGYMLPTEGNIQFFLNNTFISTDRFYEHIAFSAPYMELIETMTLEESLNFYHLFKPLTADIKEIAATCGLEKSLRKPIKNFSSGMKQRVKLAQAFFTKMPILLLDEPCSNLDNEGVELYQFLSKNYTQNKIVIIASNEKKEIANCNQIIEITKFL